LSSPAQLVDLGQQLLGVDDDPVADDARRPLVQDARRHKVQDELLIADHHRVARVAAALGPDHHVEILRQEIDDLALSLVAPLHANDARVQLIHLLLSK